MAQIFWEQIRNELPDAGEFLTGSLGVSGSLVVTGSLQISEDILVNDITVGRGGGNNFQNTAVGRCALNANTSGRNNTGFGANTLETNTDACRNSAIGQYALGLTNGNDNTAIGYAAGYNRPGGTNGGNNRQSIYIGSYSEPGANPAGGSSLETINQIVIGYDATGNGSNTVTLGNDNITDTYLKGNVIGPASIQFISQSSTPTATQGGMFYSSSNEFYLGFS